MKNTINLGLCASILSIALLIGCKKEEVGPVKSVPEVSTTAVTSIGNTDATGGGNVTDDGNDDVTARGIVWGTSTAPTTSLSTKTSDGNGTGAFTSALTSLTPGTQYFVRAYATNSEGTSYGNEVTFTTGEEAPTVTTTAASSLTASSVTLGGNVTSIGTSPVTSRGVVYSTSQNPTIALTTKTSNGTGAGSFTASLTGLSEGTLYYARAYATSTVGTSYGDQVSFTTKTIQDLSLALDGVNDHVTIPHSSALNLGNNFTIEAWVYLNNSGGAFQTILHKWSQNQYTLELYDNKINFVVKTDDGFFVLEDLNPFPRGEWIHVAGVRSGNTMYLYQDGLLQRFKTITGNTSTATSGSMVIGKRSDSNANYLSGRVDEIRIWNLARTRTQIDDNKNNNFTGNESGLVGYFPMKSYATSGENNQGITEVVDYSSQKNNGTLFNFGLNGTSSNWFSNRIAITSFNVGQYHRGGVVGYILQSGDPGYNANSIHGIIVSLNDLSSNTAPWGCDLTTIGDTFLGIGQGDNNTFAINQGCSEAGIASRLTFDLVRSGFSDWFVPSRDELNLLYINRNSINAAIVSNSGQGFKSEIYWTSSEQTSISAYTQSFISGFQGSASKTANRLVRPIRYF